MLDSTAAVMNFMPRAPSITEGNPVASGSGSRPSSRGRDDLRDVAVNIRETFQIAFRMAGRHTGGLGGGFPGSGARAGDKARGLAERREVQVVGVFLRP